MKLASASLTMLMAASAFASDDGYPHPPAPRWEATDDKGLRRIFEKTIGDRLGRVKWEDAQFQREKGKPLETIRDSVLAVGEGRKVAPRVTKASACYFFTVPDDEKHWLPEDPHHWEKPEQLPVWECLVVEPPPDPAGAAKFPGLAGRVYGVPIYVKGKVSPREVVEIVDRFWRELVAQCAAPEHGQGSAMPASLNRDGTPMWQTLDALSVSMQDGRRIAALHMQIGPGDDTEGFPFWLEQTDGGWVPADGFAGFFPWN